LTEFGRELRTGGEKNFNYRLFQESWIGGYAAFEAQVNLILPARERTAY
jgi:hypothetical protein